ncbi:retrovirus-related pol polyprotein from transposon TNT 1-94 [Tanacetum coccineum]
MTIVEARKTVGNYKQAEKGVPLCVQQTDWLDDTDEELDEQELEAHYNFMAKIQEVVTTESGPTFDVEPMEQVQSNDDYNVFTNERQHSEQPDSINDNLLMEKFDGIERVQIILEESNRTRDRYLGALHNKEIELAKYKRYNDCTIEKDSLEYLEYVQSLEKEVDELESEKANFSKEYDLLFQIQVRQPLFQVIERVIHKTSVNGTQLRSNQMKDKIVLNFILFPFDSDARSTMSETEALGNDLLTDNRGSDLYIITLQETMSATPICFMAKTSPTQAWLWHRSTVSCELGKAKRISFKTKTVPSSKGRLNLLHMDLCGPMRIESINGKKYILGIEFLNKTLHAYFKEEGIELQTSTPGTPEQNGAIERRNRTLVEDARMMLSAFNLPLLFWVEAIATAC